MTDTPIALEARKADGARLFSPSAGRNKAIVSTWLAQHLPDRATVLELGSGTGEHGAALGLRRPDVLWQYSDPDAASRASQLAWKRKDWPEPLDIDLTQPDWAQSHPRYNAIFSANMIHIAPIEALVGLVDGAATVTDEVILYGPFLFGEKSALSNLEFDVSLKRRDVRWGVRELEDVKHIFDNAGFKQVQSFDMPCNNYIVRLSRHP